MIGVECRQVLDQEQHVLAARDAADIKLHERVARNAERVARWTIVVDPLRHGGALRHDDDLAWRVHEGRVLAVEAPIEYDQMRDRPTRHPSGEAQEARAISLENVQ